MQIASKNSKHIAFSKFNNEFYNAVPECDRKPSSDAAASTWVEFRLERQTPAIVSFSSNRIKLRIAKRLFSYYLNASTQESTWTMPTIPTTVQPLQRKPVWSQPGVQELPTAQNTQINTGSYTPHPQYQQQCTPQHQFPVIAQPQPQPQPQQQYAQQQYSPAIAHPQPQQAQHIAHQPAPAQYQTPMEELNAARQFVSPVSSQTASSIQGFSNQQYAQTPTPQSYTPTPVHYQQQPQGIYTQPSPQSQQQFSPPSMNAPYHTKQQVIYQPTPQARPMSMQQFPSPPQQVLYQPQPAAQNSQQRPQSIAQHPSYQTPGVHQPRQQFIQQRPQSQYMPQKSSSSGGMMGSMGKWGTKLGLQKPAPASAGPNAKPKTSKSGIAKWGAAGLGALGVIGALSLGIDGLDGAIFDGAAEADVGGFFDDAGGEYGGEGFADSGGYAGEDVTASEDAVNAAQTSAAIDANTNSFTNSLI